MVTLVFLVVALSCTFWRYKQLRYRLGTVAFLAPSLIFMVGIALRYALGSLILVVTPEDLVIRGEYNQYFVTWKYVNETSFLWLVYVSSAALGLIVANRVLRDTKEIKRGESLTVSTAIEESFKNTPPTVQKTIRILVLTGLGIFLMETLVGIVSGSTDRGSGYEYWAQQAFKPVSAFVAFTRMKQVIFLMVPLALKVSSVLRVRFAIFFMSIFVIIGSIFTGGRGSALYPVVMIWLGWVISVPERKKLLTVTIALAVGLSLSVPILAAYRDSGVMSRTESYELVSRAKGLFTGVDGKKVMYRFQAFGRELYACSDSFMFLPRNKHELLQGFRDINRKTISDILTPRVLSNNRDIQKNDASMLAKRLIGVKNDTWFPCISSVGDLWRRGGTQALVAGGILIGLLIGMLERAWIAVVTGSFSVSAMLISFLPASYIQAGLYGTIYELIWQLAWELPKYIVCIWAIGIVVRFSSRGYFQE